MAVIGGGLMTDNDVININVPPPPGCDTLPNNGKLTTHDSHVPSVISGDSNAFNGFIDGIAGSDWNTVMQATGQNFLSVGLHTSNSPSLTTHGVDDKERRVGFQKLPLRCRARIEDVNSNSPFQNAARATTRRT